MPNNMIIVFPMVIIISVEVHDVEEKVSIYSGMIMITQEKLEYRRKIMIVVVVSEIGVRD